MPADRLNGSGNHTEGSIRVVVADDHPLYRRCVVDILRKEERIEVVGEAENGLEAVTLAERVQPDVLIMDLTMPVMTGTEAIARIHLSGLSVRILILTGAEDISCLLRAFKSGAQGCIIKSVTPDELVRAVRAAAAGEAVIPDRLLSAIWSEMSQIALPASASQAHPANPSPLTAREIEVLRQIETGASNRKIAEKLCISENTIRNRIHDIFGKLRVTSRAQAVAYAVREGLIPARGESPDFQDEAPCPPEA